MPPYLRALRSFLRERGPALVHANSILTAPDGLMARGVGAAVMLHVHEMVPRNLRGRLLRRLAWQRFDEVVAVSAASAREMTWRGRYPRVVYEAAPIPAEPAPTRRDPDPFTVGTVGVVSHRKGSDIFVDAAAIVRQRRPDIRFELVAGSVAEREERWGAEVLARARAAGVNYIERADVEERLRQWDAFALPSRADPCPIALLEAMAAGLPVIGARRDGIAEQITPGSGLLVEPEDPRALATAIERLAAEPPEARAALGSAARARVEEAFTVERQADALNEAYEAAIAKARMR